MRLSANRFGWLALPLFCLILGYLLVWQRGLYNDDYSHYERFRNASSTLAALTYNPDFPVRALFWPVSGGLDALALSHGLLVRFVLAAGAGLNALLLGWLVYRLLRSRLAAIVAGWLFLMPFFSWDVMLWTTSANHLFGPTFGLLFLHACLSALQNERLSWRSIVVCSACLMTSMLFVETSLAVAAIVPLLALCVPLAERPGARLFALKRSFLIIGIPLAVAALFVLLFYTGGSQVLAGRSAIDASIGGIMQRLPQYANRLRLLTVSGQFGRQVVKDALELGRSALGDSPLGLALAAGAILALVAQIAAWRREPGRAPATRAGLLLGAGVAWFGFVLLFPAILVKQQFLEYKFLYFSGAGLCVAAGAAACILAQVLRQVWWERFVLAATGMVVIVASVGLLGFASAFAERYRLDSEQAAAVVAAVPVESLPESVYMIPLQTDERLFGRQSMIGRLLSGVFETPWASAAALRMAYGRGGIRSLAGNRWAPIVVEVADSGLKVQQTLVPLDQCLFFTYRDGTAYAIASLTIESKSGPAHVVRLPLAQRLPGETPMLSNVFVPAP